MCLKAFFILSDDSDFTKFSLALCSAFRFCLIISLYFGSLSDGSSSVSTEGRLTFLPNTSWLGLYPNTFCKEFFAHTAQARAVSNGHFASSFVFIMVSKSMAFPLSTIPLLNGDSPGVVLVSIPNSSFISLKTSLLNSPPQSE